MSKLQIHRGWMIRRVLSLPDRATTRQVRDALKLGERTLRRWLANFYFKNVGVAENVNGKWYWHRERLLPWIIVAFKIKMHSNATWITLTQEEASMYGYAQNPQTDDGLIIVPVPKLDQARQVLGMPENYLVRSDRLQSEYTRPISEELQEEVPE